MKRITFPHKIHLMNIIVIASKPIHIDVSIFGKKHEVTCHHKSLDMFEDVAMIFVTTRRNRRSNKMDNL